MTTDIPASDADAQPLAVAPTAELGLGPEHADVCKAVNADRVLQSLLYDLGLLPEQTQNDPVLWSRTLTIVYHFDVAVTNERERCADLAEDHKCGSADDFVCQHQNCGACIAGLIRKA